MWGVWANFISEQIEFELGKIDKKSKIQLFVEDKTVSSKKFSEIWCQKNGQIKQFLEVFEKFFLKNTITSIHEGGLDKFQTQNQ